jgi:hypothetical protein
MKLLLVIVLTMFVGAGCVRENTVTPSQEPLPQTEVLEKPEPSLPDLVIQEDDTVLWTAPDDFKSDTDAWKTTDQPVRIRGCEEWKKRDPKADC